MITASIPCSWSRAMISSAASRMDSESSTYLMETGFSQEKRRLIVSAAWTLSSTVISCKRPNSPKRESAADLLRRAASKLSLLFSLRGILVTLFLNPLAQVRQFAIRKMGAAAPWCGSLYLSRCWDSAFLLAAGWPLGLAVSGMAAPEWELGLAAVAGPGLLESLGEDPL